MSNGNGNGKGNGNSKKSRKKGKCFYCDKDGHYKSECRKLKADREKEKGSGESLPKGSYGGSAGAFAASIINNTSAIATNLNASSMDVLGDYLDLELAALKASVQEVKTSADIGEWITDTGTSHHMQGRREVYSRFLELDKGQIRVYGISAKPMNAAGIGDIMLR